MNSERIMPNTDKFFNSKDSLVLTVPEVAKILRVSPGTVYNAVKRGDLPHKYREKGYCSTGSA